MNEEKQIKSKLHANENQTDIITVQLGLDIRGTATTCQNCHANSVSEDGEWCWKCVRETEASLAHSSAIFAAYMWMKIHDDYFPDEGN